MLYSRSTPRNEGLFGSANYAALLIAIGLATLLRSSFENRHDLQVLKTEYPSISFRRSLARILAALVSILGILALIAVILWK